MAQSGLGWKSLTSLVNSKAVVCEVHFLMYHFIHITYSIFSLYLKYYLHKLHLSPFPSAAHCLENKIDPYQMHRYTLNVRFLFLQGKMEFTYTNSLYAIWLLPKLDEMFLYKYA